jgi:hypothetical protein
MEKAKNEPLNEVDKEKSLQESFSQMLSFELKNLQNKLAVLETRMNHRDSPAAGEEFRNDRKKIRKNRKSAASSKGTSQRSEVSQSSERTDRVAKTRKTPSSRNSEDGEKSQRVQRNSFSFQQADEKIRKKEKKIRKSEKELRNLEDSLRLNSSQTSSKSCQEKADKNSELVRIRRGNAGLLKENRILMKKMKSNLEITKRIRNLVKEINDLKASFKRSECIRNKQKEVIKQLKKEVLKAKGKTRAKSAQPKVKSKPKKN